MDDSLKQDFLNSLLIVLVIYKMKINEASGYQSLTAALSAQKKSASLFIYDNSPQPQEMIIDECWNLFYHHDSTNAGVSKAYNEGFKKAKELNKKWLLLVDQDTLFSLDIFEKYMEAIALHPNQELFSPVVKSKTLIVSPFRFARGRGTAVTKVDPGLCAITDFKFINSGLLVSTNLFDKCKGYDDRFPLDFSDIVFAERAQKFVNGFVVVNTECSSSLSSHANSCEEAVNRFDHFVAASKAYGQIRDQAFAFFFNRCLRSVKLSFKFRSLAFLKIAARG